MKSVRQRFKNIMTPLLIIGSITMGVPFTAYSAPKMDGYGPPCPMMHGDPGGSGEFGFGPMMMLEEPFGGPMPPFLHGLKLSETQRDKIFELLHAQVPSLHEKGKEIHKGRLALHKLSLSDQYDEAKVKELAENGARVIAEIARLIASTDNQIYQLLTPEQRKQLADDPVYCKHGIVMDHD
ncbi:periplasmic protein CpxP/Spy [Gammaproteobacteria bacterium]